MTERFRRYCINAEQTNTEQNEIAEQNEIDMPPGPPAAEEPVREEQGGTPRANWYTMSGQPSRYWAPEAPAWDEREWARQRKRSRTKTISLIVCGVLLVAAIVAATLNSWHVEVRRWSVAGEDRPRERTATVPDEAEEAPREEFFDDFRDYFENYFVGSNDIDIPAAPLGTGVTLQLQEPTGRQMTLQDIYERVSPAVVSVAVYQQGQEYGWGTGVVFTDDGYVVTNTHVIQGCDRAKVTLTNGKTYEALLVGFDEASDIAVLYLEDAEDLPYADFGRSDALRVGDEVVAIGNPLGEDYAGTMTNGIISGIDRTVTYNGHTMTMLQTNAALNEGNSGGALINSAGQVVGITNMKIMSSYFATVEGIGFAIPSSVVKEVADQLIRLGYVPGEPTIGIVAGAVSQTAMDVYDLPEGVYVSQVNEGSDALKKGLQVGDVIVAVNGQNVTTVSEVNLIKEGLSVGDTITLTIYRDGKTFDLDIALVDKGDIR